MSFNKKSSYNSNAGNRKTTLLKTGFTSSSHSDNDQAVGSGKKNVVSSGCSSPPSQNKTPNKSGLTPVRPTKSPGTGMKQKSGLTPVRPGVSQGTSKSPFSQRPKLKSGLLPIKPSMQGGTQQSKELNCSMFNDRRKSGLLPMKPVSKGATTGGLLPSFSFQDKTEVSVLEPKSFGFTARGGMSQLSAPKNTVEGRRKSGLLPVKHSLGAIPSNCQPQWKPRPSISNSGMRRLPQIKINKPIEATPSLNAITEDSESSFRSNLSGIVALDDSQDMSVVIRPKIGQQTSRIPLPRTTLDNAHFSSDSEITQSRIPKRVLFFPDEDEGSRPHPNVLKDGSSKTNTMEGTSSLGHNLQSSDILPALDKPKPDSSTNKDKKETLLERKREIQNAMQKMSSELKVIEEQLRTLGEKELIESTNSCENLKEDIDESDSPFAQVGSPVFVVPLQHLTLAKSKQPDNMYNCFRESCSFLKTPQHSAFAKPRDSLRLAQQSEESPNVSQRVQKQLADLFAE